jgi:hypothetical protein
VVNLEQCTLSEKILLVATQLEEAGQSPFSAETLIVEVWQEHPRAFGLKGYESRYPDANRVLAQLMGEKGLIRRGWLTKVGQKLYSLTADGRNVVQRLRQGQDTPSLTAKRKLAQLSHEDNAMLMTMLGGVAWAKAAEGKQLEWIFSDACNFWSMGDRGGAAVDVRLAEIQQRLEQLTTMLAIGPLTLSDGKVLGVADVKKLRELHGQLVQRFARHLSLLRSRGVAA